MNLFFDEKNLIYQCVIKKKLFCFCYKKIYFFFVFNFPGLWKIICKWNEGIPYSLVRYNTASEENTLRHYYLYHLTHSTDSNYNFFYQTIFFYFSTSKEVLLGGETFKLHRCFLMLFQLSFCVLYFSFRCIKPFNFFSV